MRVKEYTARKGWDVPDNVKKAWNVDIGFVNSETGEDDETEFSICAFDTNDLAELFAEFCKENKIADDTVTYISVVEMADDFEKLS